MAGPLLVLALDLALAVRPEILVPPWPLAPDGDLVAVRGEAPLAASRAALERIAPGLFRVVPAPGAADVELAAGGARAVVPVEPPAGNVAIAVAPPAPVKGRNSKIGIEVAVFGADGAPDLAAAPPMMVASSGQVRDLAPVGPGRFRGVYEPAPTRHPEIGVLLALAPRCPLCATPRAIGWAVVPLTAAIDLPGQAEPGTQTTITVGGRAFGPVTADRSGRFSIPIEVPPGASFGTAVAVDRTGNRRTTQVDLHLPDVDALACAAWPTAIRADGRSTAGVWCVAATPSGAPAPGARIVLEATVGEADGPAPFRGALQLSRYRAPRGGGREAVLRATYPDGGPGSRHEISIGLAAGAPAEIAASLAEEPVPVGGSVRAETSVRDGLGGVVGLPHGPPGAKVGFVAPDRFVARAEPGDYVQKAALAFALSPGREAASVALRKEGSSWIAEARTVDARPAAGVALRFGSGASAVTDERGTARIPATSARESVVAEGGTRAVGFEGIAAAPEPFEIERTVSVRLRPPAPVDVFAWVEGGALLWRVRDAEGRPLPGRRVEIRAGGIDLGREQRDGEGGRAEIRGGRGAIAVVDVDTGVAAVVEIR